jgi:hypothetical protein
VSFLFVIPAQAGIHCHEARGFVGRNPGNFYRRVKMDAAGRRFGSKAGTTTLMPGNQGTGYLFTRFD